MSKQAPAIPTPSKLPWVLVTVLLLALAGTGAWAWFAVANAKSTAAPGAEEGTAGHGGAEAAPAGGKRGPAIYFALDPAFVVNLADPDLVRYLQADVQLMTRDPATAAAIELHAPAIRNRLLLMFGQHTAAQLSQRAAKERLQESGRDEVRSLLKAEGAPAAVEAMYFTSFVTQ